MSPQKPIDPTDNKARHFAIDFVFRFGVSYGGRQPAISSGGKQKRGSRRLANLAAFVTIATGIVAGTGLIRSCHVGASLANYE